MCLFLPHIFALCVRESIQVRCRRKSCRFRVAANESGMVHCIHGVTCRVRSAGQFAFFMINHRFRLLAADPFYILNFRPGIWTVYVLIFNALNRTYINIIKPVINIINWKFVFLAVEYRLHPGLTFRTWDLTFGSCNL